MLPPKIALEIVVKQIGWLKKIKIKIITAFAKI